MTASYVCLSDRSSVYDNNAGQRLQSMKKGQDPAKDVDLVASINAAEKERGLGGFAGTDSDDE